ncbi:hypothetical protein IWQ60_004372 [Tieghemiomyces parasiticus]|uniref:T-complex protein 11 n=1 Tax=Tieghemiomyces parasiticus TaxID=78921 RepID=A0A9W8A8C0_9FUNG|nr:hypothetical protein IWQ60_004372 [Tieghemiomyces parasiticus]
MAASDQGPPPPASPPYSAATASGNELTPTRKKPCHVATRLQQRREQDAHAECVYTGTSPTQAQLNHDAYLAARRAKAAEHLHHVELVRTQQQSQTQAQTDQQSVALRESLETASQNRARLLREQAEQCADRVRRAKRVAQLQAFRQQQKVERQRQQLEERLRLTEARRDRILRLPRLAAPGVGIAGGPPSPPPQHRCRQEVIERGVVALQRTFRGRQVTSAHQELHRHQFSLAGLRELGPAAATQAMTTAPVMRAADRLVRVVLAAARDDQSDLSELPTGPTDGSAASTSARARAYPNAGRFLLMGMLLAVYPSEILSPSGPQDRLLADLASSMARSLERLTDRPRAATDPERVRAFVRDWDTFYRTFLAWKRKDSRHVLETLIAHFLELDRLWHTVRTAGGADETWRAPIAAQRDAIREQIERFGGPSALERLHRAQEAARREYSQPAASPAVPLAKDALTAAATATTNQTDTVAPPAADETDEDIPAPTGIAEYLQNEKLAHEIAVDPYFKLGQGPGPEVASQIRSVAQRAYFDHLRQLFADLRAVSPADSSDDPAALPSILTDCLVELFRDYRDLLLSVAPARGPLRATIEARLDVDLLEQQWRARPASLAEFDFKAYLSFIADLMAQMCAPERDSEVAHLRALDDPFRGAQVTLEALQRMQQDYLNAQITLIRPFLARHAARYEREHFDRRLQSGDLTLDHTRRWLEQAVTSSGRGDATEGSQFLAWYYEGVLNLLFATQVADPGQCPETFLLDLDRLFGFQNELQALTIVSALLILAKNLAPPTVRQRLLHRGATGPASPSQLLKDRLLELLRHDETNVDHLVAELQRAISSGPNDGGDLAANETTSSPLQTLSPATTYLGGPHKPVAPEVVRTLVLKTLSYRDPVFNVLSRRLRTVLRTWLLYPGHFSKPAEGDSASEAGPAPANPLGIRMATGFMSRGASEMEPRGGVPQTPPATKSAAAESLLRSYGLDLVAPEMRQLFTLIGSLLSHNRRTYGVYYDQILRELTAG